jgi:hypothetical protein
MSVTPLVLARLGHHRNFHIRFFKLVIFTVYFTKFVLGLYLLKKIFCKPLYLSHRPMWKMKQLLFTRFIQWFSLLRDGRGCQVHFDPDPKLESGLQSVHICNITRYIVLKISFLLNYNYDVTRPPGLYTTMVMVLWPFQLLKDNSIHPPEIGRPGRCWTYRCPDLKLTGMQDIN